MPDPYNGGVVFLLFEEDASFSDAIGQLPIEFWSGVQDWATHCISDGEWFVYLRRNATVVATAERMPHFVRRALGTYQLLAKHLQPFPLSMIHKIHLYGSWIPSPQPLPTGEGRGEGGGLFSHREKDVGNR